MSGTWSRARLISTINSLNERAQWDPKPSRDGKKREEAWVAPASFYASDVRNMKLRGLRELLLCSASFSAELAHADPEPSLCAVCHRTSILGHRRRAP